MKVVSIQVIFLAATLHLSNAAPLVVEHAKPSDLILAFINKIIAAEFPDLLTTTTPSTTTTSPTTTKPPMERLHSVPNDSMKVIVDCTPDCKKSNGIRYIASPCGLRYSKRDKDVCNFCRVTMNCFSDIAAFN